MEELLKTSMLPKSFGNSCACCAISNFCCYFFTFNSLKEALIIFAAIPLSAIGGVMALWLRGMPFSVSAGIGFIALFGVAVLNGIVLIAYFNSLEKQGITIFMSE
jgi:cobalt-zinc-cadmium resistance protein CzcA